MSRPPLSDAQRAAVTQDFEDTCVTAGAGSGKTRVLAERYVQVVTAHKLRVRDVAALTFTEKAAAEMQERIATYFAERGDETARADVEFAPISTIHAFCARLLRLHAIEAGVDPQFAMLDAGEASLIREDAALRAENRLRVEAPEAFLAYEVLPRGKARTLLMDLLDTLRGAGVSVADLAWIPGPVDAAQAQADARAALPDLEGCSGLLDGEPRATFDAVIADVHAVLDAPPDEDLRFAAFRAFRVADAVNGLRGTTKRPFPASRNALTEALGAFAAARLDAYGAVEVLPHLSTVLNAFDAAYAELKDERSALDFTDLELEALALLDRLAARRRVPDLAPKALLVDEYQDTNPLQARILARLREVAPQFSVGDPKQSIYRFRRADVGVIMAERARVGPEARHELATSYRAHPDLVARLNALNALMFAGDAGGVPYEALEAGAEFDSLTLPALRFALIDAGPAADKYDARDAEAAWIAEEIRRLVADEVPRAKQHGKRTGPLGYGDIAILFRARGDIPIYEEALAAAGVPSLTLKGQGYLESDEIRDLIYLLRVIQNPADEHALACCVTGPVFAAGDVELLRWFRPGDAGGAWARIREDAAAGGLLGESVSAVEALRREAAMGSIAAVVEGALDRLGLLDAALASPGGERRAANLRKAVELARRMDRIGERDLGDLLRRLATLREREVGESEAAVGGEDAEVVRLTTVHGAKGLEYPVVFLADAGRRKGGTPPHMHVDAEGRVASKIKDPLEGGDRKPGGYEAAGAQESAAERHEDRRVFYVATTRAEEMLVVSAWCKGRNKSNPRPKDLDGWGKDLYELLGASFEHGTYTLPVGDVDLQFELVDAVGTGAMAAPAPVPPVDATESDRAAARALLDRADRETAPLGGTRFVATVSELLTFADAPPRYYTDVRLMGGRRPEPALGSTVLALADELDPSLDPMDADDLGALTAERRDLWDEPAETHDGVDRSVVGRAVHRAIERLDVASADVEALARHAVYEECGPGAPETLAPLVAAMVGRYAASPLAGQVRATPGARREVSFHARLRFPGGEPVAGYDSLLVKGSIDLWLPTDGGVLVVDHKTNRRSERLPTPEAVGAHYRWQLCLYAAATERLTGEDVAGARLLLLDPSWGADAVEVEVDVSGEALREARSLCRAFAIAEQQGRYPPDWRRLLA